MIKRDFFNSDIKKLASRVNLAKWTVKEGKSKDGSMQRSIIDSVMLVVEK